MRRLLLLAVLPLAALPHAPRATARSMPDCAASARITPVAGDPGAFRIATPHGVTLARHPVAQPGALARAQTVVTINLLADEFDADNNPATVHDTVVVAPGTTVRWLLQTGTHTITNGYDSSDPTAASKFSYLMDSTHTEFDSTFAKPTWLDFFCFFHEPIMEGTVAVRQNLGVDGPTGVNRATFTRPPSPNPARGGLQFTIALPRAQAVTLSVLDVGGRRVALLASGTLPAGEHPYAWSGRDDAGRALPSGRYLVRLAAGAVSETRAVTLLR